MSENTFKFQKNETL